MPRISPTAYYTDEVWAGHDIGRRELTSTTGRLRYQGLQRLMRPSTFLLAARKRTALRRLGTLCPQHRIEPQLSNL